MKSILKSALALSVSGLLIAQSSAALSINIFAGRLDDATGAAPITGTTLIQLVNLGPDGVFNQINVDDGSTVGLARWVSGDDSVLDLAFTVDGAPDPAFASTKAFDLRVGDDSNATGNLIRIFDFAASLPNGTKLGIRWFPGINATAFESTTLAIGQAYGEASRQSAPVNGGVPWIINSGDIGYEFDPIATTEIGGTDPATAGNASLTVVPEPAAIGMSLIGAAGLTLLRRRRA